MRSWRYPAFWIDRKSSIVFILVITPTAAYVGKAYFCLISISSVATTYQFLHYRKGFEWLCWCCYKYRLGYLTIVSIFHYHIVSTCTYIRKQMLVARYTRPIRISAIQLDAERCFTSINSYRNHSIVHTIASSTGYRCQYRCSYRGRYAYYPAVKLTTSIICYAYHITSWHVGIIGNGSIGCQSAITINRVYQIWRSVHLIAIRRITTLWF